MLQLRPYMASDASEIVKWTDNEYSFRQWCADRYESFPITADMMNEHYRKKDDTNMFRAMTAIDEKGKVVGHLTMRFTDHRMKIVRFGFVIIDPKKRGKGYAKEMLELAKKYAFETLRAEKITLVVFDTNKPAYSCYKSVGFKKDPTGEEIYSFFGEKWKGIEMEYVQAQ